MLQNIFNLADFLDIEGVKTRTFEENCYELAFGIYRLTLDLDVGNQD